MSSQNVVPLGVRMPADVREWVEANARRNLRSLNSEIVLALREKMQRTSEKSEPRHE